MRPLHAPLLAGIERALVDIFEGGYLADKVIQRLAKENRQWGSHDRRLFAEITYDCVRWWRRLGLVIGETKAPLYAARIQAWCRLNEIDLHANAPNALNLDVQSLKAAWDNPDLTRAERASIPDWIDEYAGEQLGERWDALLPVLNGTAPVYLRANRLRLKPEELVDRLAQENIAARVAEADAVVLDRRANVHATAAFKRGEFEVQDLHSQRVASWLDPQPGERVIDACAGAGGKSLHLAARMKNKGKLIAMDVVASKLEELRRRATRAGVGIIEARVIENSKTIKRLHGGADRLLLDVPCTGMGVWRRNPDAKWRLSRDVIARVGELQKQILAAYPAMVKPGGTFVYSTCSILPEENERRLHAWQSQNETTWQIEDEATLWPEANGGDGFYIARLKRSDRAAT